MTPYSGPKPSDFYTLSQTKLLENHTLHIYPIYDSTPHSLGHFSGIINQVRPGFTCLVSDKGNIFLNGVEPGGYQSRCR